MKLYFGFVFVCVLVLSNAKSNTRVFHLERVISFGIGVVVNNSHQWIENQRDKCEAGKGGREGDVSKYFFNPTEENEKMPEIL